MSLIHEGTVEQGERREALKSWNEGASDTGSPLEGEGAQAGACGERTEVPVIDGGPWRLREKRLGVRHKTGSLSSMHPA